MITNKDEAKAEHISCDYKCKFNKATCKSEYEDYCKCKEDYSLNPSTCICECSKYLKSIADNSVTAFDEIIVVMDIVLT